jgi:hypothetical protein
MGLYDCLTVKYPLPIEGANDLQYQSKTTPSQSLSQYELRENGELWCDDFSDDQFHLCEFTGEFTFYAMWNSNSLRDWIEFLASFDNGLIRSLHVIFNNKGCDSAEIIQETGRAAVDKFKKCFDIALDGDPKAIIQLQALSDTALGLDEGKENE